LKETSYLTERAEFDVHFPIGKFFRKLFFSCHRTAVEFLLCPQAIASIVTGHDVAKRAVQYLEGAYAG
jgi:hypothetical protein